ARSQGQGVKFVIDFEGREWEIPLPLEPTFKEARLIKQLTGLRVGEIPAAFAAGDHDAILAGALLAFLRADTSEEKALERFRRLENMKAQDVFRMETEVEDDPPAEAADAADTSENEPRPSSTSDTSETPASPGTPF